jgi:hypothetical protein
LLSYFWIVLFVLLCLFCQDQNQDQLDSLSNGDVLVEQPGLRDGGPALPGVLQPVQLTVQMVGLPPSSTQHGVPEQFSVSHPWGGCADLPHAGCIFRTHTTMGGAMVHWQIDALIIGLTAVVGGLGAEL